MEFSAVVLPVLITGVGGPLGQALIKAVRAADLNCQIIGVDRLPLSVGLDWVDRGEVVPNSSQEEEYLEVLSRICREENVRAVLPGSEGELQVLSRRRSTLQKLGAKVIASPPEVLEIGLCKLCTCQFLQQAGRRFPKFASLEDTAAVQTLLEATDFPLIAKPHRGSGSQGFYLVRNSQDLAYLKTFNKPYVLQERLLPDDQEYTVASFTDPRGKQLGAICMRRELAAGNTYRAWVVEQPDVRQEAMAVVKALQPQGPCNVQLRLTADGPVTFEINPRFSGTTGMRSHFGYNEVELALRCFVLGQACKAPQVRQGVALRFWEETYREKAA